MLARPWLKQLSFHPLFHTIASTRMCRPITTQGRAVIGLPSPHHVLVLNHCQVCSGVYRVPAISRGPYGRFLSKMAERRCEGCLMFKSTYGIELAVLQHNVGLFSVCNHLKDIGTSCWVEGNTFCLILQLQFMSFIHLDSSRCSYVKNIWIQLHPISSLLGI